MDIASLIGLIVCIVLVFIAIVAGNGFGAIINFLDFPSALITFGGAFSCVLASTTMSEFKAGLKSFGIPYIIPNRGYMEGGGVLRPLLQKSKLRNKWLKPMDRRNQK